MQLSPPGFHVIFIPFSGELRNLNIAETAKGITKCKKYLHDSVTIARHLSWLTLTVFLLLHHYDFLLIILMKLIFFLTSRPVSYKFGLLSIQFTIFTW